MPPKTLISIIVAGVAFVLGAQAATAGPMPDAFERAVAQKQAQSNLGTYTDAFERAVVAHGLESSLSTYRDANERVVDQGHGLQSTDRSPDAFERAVLAQRLLESNVGTYLDAAERAVPTAGPPSISPTGSGREIEWPQIGIGFGVGIILMLGLYLALKATRTRPLAH